MLLRQMTRYTAIILIMLGSVSGCSKPELHSLQNSYAPPAVPTELPEFLTAQPNTKLYDSLPDDNKTISLHEYYRDGHRDGWNEAFEDWRRDRRFKTDEQCRQIAMITVFLNGRVAGYNNAKAAIEKRSKDD